MSENYQFIPYVHHKLCVRNSFLTLAVIPRYLAKTIDIPEIARIQPTVNSV